MRNMDSRNGTAPDKIPPKIVKISVNIFQFFKGKGERTVIKNYSLVSILSCF